jgi:hypothetical protein
MRQDLTRNRWILDAGNDLHRTAAGRTGLHIDKVN